ncbi:hypothetical protein OIU34_00770 [Pararhizobium sp. BT-229]|uniref:hypothetical protein n=1 Tax=Pararhizobium sp. BT-229 TaxID=2986923 RepID=UPI0021F6FA96|nr:hypothetical protein [Pararhizobium sp. BT-229]MCV9960417.1 hypothetical protein [Pararhizobium sp. BT-229]
MKVGKGNPRRLRQPHYTLEQFAKKYGLHHDEAKILFEKFGPSSVELDLLMRAKGIKPLDDGTNIP